MIPIGAEATARLRQCADYWPPEELAKLREQLPAEFHTVDLQDLRRRWINIRVAGHGPEKGSMKRPKIPERALEILYERLCPECVELVREYVTAR
jgi:hypothetical protein